MGGIDTANNRHSCGFLWLWTPVGCRDDPTLSGIQGLNLCFRAAGPQNGLEMCPACPFQFTPCCSSPRPPLRLISFFGCVSWGNSHPNGDKWKSCPQPCKEGNSNLSSFSLFPRQYLPQHETDKLNIGFTAHRLPG